MGLTGYSKTWIYLRVYFFLIPKNKTTILLPILSAGFSYFNEIKYRLRVMPYTPLSHRHTSLKAFVERLDVQGRTCPFRSVQLYSILIASPIQQSTLGDSAHSVATWNTLLGCALSDHIQLIADTFLYGSYFSWLSAGASPNKLHRWAGIFLQFSYDFF